MEGKSAEFDAAISRARNRIIPHNIRTDDLFTACDFEHKAKDNREQFSAARQRLGNWDAERKKLEQEVSKAQQLHERAVQENVSGEQIGLQAIGFRSPTRSWR